MVVLKQRFYNEITFVSRLVAEIAGKDLECEGIIAEGQSIIPTQEICKGKAMLEDIIGAFADATVQKLKVTGIWHSHGSLPVFHSLYDDFHLYSTILPLIKKQNKMLGKYAETVTSIVINNRGKSYALCISEKGPYEDAISFEGNNEYIDSVELIKSISTKVSYKGVLLKDMENYNPTLDYYKQVKAAIWQEVFIRGMEKLERRCKDEAKKGKGNCKRTKKGFKKKDSRHSEGNRNPEDNNKQVEEKTKSNNQVHCNS